MPTENKYEIRSQEVQEVLSTPPRFLTFWGTGFVMVILVLGLVFLSRYKVMQSIRVPVQITASNGKLLLLIDTANAKKIKLNQEVKLQIMNTDNSIQTSIVSIMDSTIDAEPKKLIGLASPIGNTLAPGKTTTRGEAQIQIGKETLMRLFFSKN